MKTVQKLRSAFAFWQQVAMVTLGYGAVMFWIALAFRDRLGFTNVFATLTPSELGLLLVSGGTIGLHFFRPHWEKQGRWTDVKWFAIALQGALFLGSLATGLNLLLGAFFATMALGHIVLPALNPKKEVPAE
jgi:hypothetical protein